MTPPVKSDPLYVEWMRVCFERDQNPIYVLKAFVVAHEGSLQIPEWVAQHIAQAFRLYDESKGEQSMDKLLGLSPGRGQTPPYGKLAMEVRDFALMIEVYKLESLGASIADAAHMVEQKYAQGYWDVNGQRPPNLASETIMDRYSKQDWRTKFRRILTNIGEESFFDNNQKISAFLQAFPAHSIPAGLKSRISHP